MADSSGDQDVMPRRRGSSLLLRLQKNLWLYAALAASFVIGPPFTRLLQTYRGVILEARSDEVFIGFEDRVPRWLPAPNEAAPGVIVYKERGEWASHPQVAKARDFKLMQLYERYSSTYDAVIARIDPPLAPNQASTAVADTSSGKRLRIPLWSEQLTAAAVGRHLHKMPNSWDPVLVNDGESTPKQP